MHPICGAIGRHSGRQSFMAQRNLHASLHPTIQSASCLPPMPTDQSNVPDATHFPTPNSPNHCIYTPFQLWFLDIIQVACLKSGARCHLCILNLFFFVERVHFYSFFSYKDKSCIQKKNTEEALICGQCNDSTKDKLKRIKEEECERKRD